VPELPEVETVVRAIRPRLSGRRIVDACFTVPRQLLPQTDRQIRRAIKGQHIRDVRRRGKYILVELQKGVLMIHLRMTGRLYVRPVGQPAHAHERAWFALEDGHELVFRDPRTLGTISYATPKTIDALVGKLGWEPLQNDVDLPTVREKLRTRRTPVKPLLLDQRLWAGIGNIYASEILWEARINPAKAAASLTRQETQRLMAAILDVLSRAVKKGGSTIRDFMGPDGKAGAYQKQFRVYERAGQPCLRCGSKVIRIVQAQRSTYYCRVCQKKR